MTDKLLCGSDQVDLIFDQMFGCASDVYLLVDSASDRVLCASPSATQVLGLEIAQIKARQFQSFFPEDAQSSVASMLVTAIRRGCSGRRVVECLNTESHQRLKVGMTAVRIKEGKQYCLLLCLNNEDATLQERDILALEKERFQLMCQAVSSGIIATDTRGQIQYINPVAERLLSVLADHVSEHAIDEVMHLSAEPGGAKIDSPVMACLSQRKEINCGTVILLNREGKEYAIQQTASPMLDSQGSLRGVVLLFSDVTEWNAIANKIAYQATHDSLTGLVNREEFEQRLQVAITGARERGYEHALCYIDLDRFKLVNDTVGHLAGDELLRQLTALLSGQVRGRDTLARIGGDEFALLLEHCPPDRATRLAQGLIETVSDFRFTWENYSFEVGCSIGLVTIDVLAKDTETLIHQADIACYQAKDKGRNRLQIYTPDEPVGKVRLTENQKVSDLNRALRDNRFELYCQPIKSLPEKNNRVELYEILLRLSPRNDGKLLPPGSFIPAAERYGVMTKIDRWVIDKAFHHFNEVMMHKRPVSSLSINLSGTVVSDKTLPSFIHQHLNKYQVPASKICFEIDETVVVRNMASVLPFLTELKQLGCRVALDGFGTGFSSFGTLKKLPVDYIKIDGRLVQSITHSAVDRSVVEAIHSVACTLGVKTIAEYVSSEPIIKALLEIGINYGQGYRLGLPHPLTAESEPA